MATSSHLPDPSVLFQEAVDESTRFDLSDYWTTIAELRSKGFSWRLMAEWFENRDLKVDYSALRRFHKNTPIMEIASLPPRDRVDRIQDRVCELKDRIENEDRMVSLITEAGWDEVETEIYEVSNVEFDLQRGIKASFSFQISGSAYERGVTFLAINGVGTALVDLDGNVHFEDVDGERDYGDDADDDDE